MGHFRTVRDATGRPFEQWHRDVPGEEMPVCGPGELHDYCLICGARWTWTPIAWLVERGLSPDDAGRWKIGHDRALHEAWGRAQPRRFGERPRADDEPLRRPVRPDPER